MSALLTQPEVKAGDSVTHLIDELRALSVRALRLMYLPEQRRFVFRKRRTEHGIKSEGISDRYTAIVLIGLAQESKADIREVLHGDDPHNVCQNLINDCPQWKNLGDIALTLWAARAWGLKESETVLEVLRKNDPVNGAHPTVDLAWVVTALSVTSDVVAHDRKLAQLTANRLMKSFRQKSALFPHWAEGVSCGGLRAHVGCYADLVYPIQALAHYHLCSGDKRSLELAQACADRMCQLQGDQGQWWWHYDIRTGQIVEPYPVYSVHQDAMGPMALLALQDAGGEGRWESIVRGLSWLVHAIEINSSLIDHDHSMIWRKVARREPRKLARSIQALASRAHPSFRVPGINTFLQPGSVDYECRPYHLGWLLYAWANYRVQSNPAAH